MTSALRDLRAQDLYGTLVRVLCTRGDRAAAGSLLPTSGHDRAHAADRVLLGDGRPPSCRSCSRSTFRSRCSRTCSQSVPHSSCGASSCSYGRSARKTPIFLRNDLQERRARAIALAAPLRAAFTVGHRHTNRLSCRCIDIGNRTRSVVPRGAIVLALAAGSIPCDREIEKADAHVMHFGGPPCKHS